MHHTYGASLKNLFLFADAPKLYEGVVIREIRKLSVDGLFHLSLSIDIISGGCCYLISTGPSPTNRAEPEMKFSSPYIVRECCRRILEDDVEQLKRFHDTLRNKQSTSAFADVILGHRAHQSLQEGRAIDPFAISADEETERTHELNPLL